MKIIDTYHVFAKEMFLEAEVDDDKVIKYKKKDGEPGEMKASSAKTMPSDHPAKVAYDKMSDSDSDDKSKGQALGGSDFDREAQNKKDADAWAAKMFGGHVPSRPKAKEDEPSDVDPEKPADEPSDMDTEKPTDEPEDEKPVDEPEDDVVKPKDPFGMDPRDPRYFDPYAAAKRRKRAMNASKDYKIINGKKYKAIQESKKEEKDFTKLLNENYKRFSRK